MSKISLNIDYDRPVIYTDYYGEKFKGTIEGVSLDISLSNGETKYDVDVTDVIYDD